jgi:hypothetical protein
VSYVFRLPQYYGSSTVRRLADAYMAGLTPHGADEERNVVTIGNDARQRGFLQLNELLAIAKWKSPRRAHAVHRNSMEFVEEITRFALSAKVQRSQISTLTVLDGVGWPMASVILHLCSNNEYPIFDIRALETLGHDSRVRVNDHLFWEEYSLFCRSEARKNMVSMGEFDRALWQHSYEADSRQKSVPPKAATSEH